MAASGLPVWTPAPDPDRPGQAPPRRGEGSAYNGSPHDGRRSHDPSRRTVLSGGVHWDDPIARGRCRICCRRRRRILARGRRSNSATAPISYAALEAMVETAAGAFLRAGYGKNHSVALFLGNSPDHPVNFFGALKAGARVVHLSRRSTASARSSHKLSDSGARMLVTSDLCGAAADGAEIPRKGPARPPDRLRGRSSGARSATRTRRIPDHPAIVTYSQFIDGAAKPAQWPEIAVDDVALLQYTGGTTGLPKGAMLSHGNLTSAVSIYDVWGSRARRAQRPDRARDLRAAAVPHLRADGGAAAPRSGAAI